MSARSTAFTLVAAPTVLASLGVFSVFTGVVPLAGLGLLVVAAALFVARFAKLARALNVTAAERDVRRHRFTIAAICAVVLLGSYVGYMVALSDDEIGGGTLVAYNVVGVPAMIGTVAFFIAGVLSPKATPVRETN